MVVDYTRFESLEGSSSGSEDGRDAPETQDTLVGGARSEEGLLRAFVAIHEHRLEVDRLQEAGRSSEEVAGAYDDICSRLLVLDGVRQDSEVRSMGHRVEMARARLSAARAHLAAGDAGAAEARAGLAIGAIRTWADGARGAAAGAPAEAEAGRRLLCAAPSAIDAHLCRAQARFLRRDYEAAREDALVAYSTAQACSITKQVRASSTLALRCEAALHAGGPGLDGQGLPLPPDEVDSIELGELGCSMEVPASEQAATGQEAAHGEAVEGVASSDKAVAGSDATASTLSASIPAAARKGTAAGKVAAYALVDFEAMD
mmetsp:Transcript_68471/g.221257  ORF Transcript_68471/g.221257 Transcript_68471/m.221257 type:complete len:317 (+) Transcript_68471:67-1017(+)